MQGSITQIKPDIVHGTPKAITIIIPTYNRPDILRATLTRLDKNLVFGGEIRILIGDDGDKRLFVDRKNRVNITVLPGPRRGLGANLNMLLNHVETNIVMQMDDDHWLTDTLDISDYARDLLNSKLNAGWVRLFMGERQDVYHFDTYYKLQGATFGPYWFVDADSPELYISSNRPHIKHINFHRDHYGFYPEDRTLGKTEEAWCHQYKKLRKAEKYWHVKPWVVVPLFGLSMRQWQHVGDSWQDEGL